MMQCFLKERRAQATVEMAVVAPVLIVLALIVYNLMQFACAAARFDRVAPDIVLAQGVSPQGDACLSKTATVESVLQEAMGTYSVRVKVTNEADSAKGAELLSLVAAPQRYHCEMTFAPWPQNIEIAGVALGSPLQLKHERTVVVDPWRPGVVL